MPGTGVLQVVDIASVYHPLVAGEEVFFSHSERYSCTGHILSFASTRNFALLRTYCFDDERARVLMTPGSRQNTETATETWIPYRAL